MMNKQDLTFDEAGLANLLRGELFKTSQAAPDVKHKQDISDFELISTSEKPYVSPIFSMNEDEILAFVEEFDVNELATLSTAELNHIGTVLGVDPRILVEGVD